MKKKEMFIKLKPCPFCGSDNAGRFLGLLGTVMFVCPDCGADVCFYDSESDPKASEAWNRRAKDVTE